MESLDLLVKEEILDGEFYSEKYQKRITVQKCTYIKKLPNTVIVHLKRFEFDIKTLQRTKINDICEFPFDLNLKKWCVGPYMSDESYEYSLVGVLVHSGTIEGGHYYSYIKERDLNDPYYNQWFDFNDTYVSQADISRVKSIAFGHKSDDWGGYGTCAYLLFYERKKCEPTEFDAVY
jgi:ubiquitin carboxyl-terminal hydrolase 34